MVIKNAKVLIDDKFVQSDVRFSSKIESIGESSSKAGKSDVDATGCYLIPGLIDIHTHGAMCEDASDGKERGLRTMSRYYARGGVTSWCPTTMTLPEDVLAVAMRAVASFKRPQGGAKIAGVNLEGPFLCYAKRGAQAAENLHKPDVAMFKRLNAESGGVIRLVTVAPEEKGATKFIREVSKICTVSVGHTVASYDIAVAAYKSGASHATHLFNAMPALGHRAPGVIGAACDKDATVELICDGLHIHPSTVRLTYKAFGKKLVLISDSLRCAGMPDGDYTLGGQPIRMENGRTCLTGTDTLAGSCIHLMDGVRNAVKFGIPLADAVYAASTAPAKVIRCADQIGSIAVGKCADLVLLDKDLSVKAVYIDGKLVK